MVMIIAEAGVNHLGHLETARQLIKKAAECGADIIKFQIFDAERLDPPGPHRDMLKKLQLPTEAWRHLKDYADQCDIEFMGTPFDLGALRLLVDLGVKRIKIGSADLQNKPLVDAAMATGLPVILSTGMAAMSEIYDVWSRYENAFRQVTLLHCTSAYPCPVEDVNLQAIQNMLKLWHLPVGFSDHTVDVNCAITAVALGACMIEKHLTLDRGADGPDHVSSIEPHQFKIMVEGIREIEQALGDGIKKPQPSEAAVMKVRDERAAHRCAT